jgi:hypothetical protein
MGTYEELLVKVKKLFGVEKLGEFERDNLIDILKYGKKYSIIRSDKWQDSFEKLIRNMRRIHSKRINGKYNSTDDYFDEKRGQISNFNKIAIGLSVDQEINQKLEKQTRLKLSKIKGANLQGKKRYAEALEKGKDDLKKTKALYKKMLKELS